MFTLQQDVMYHVIGGDDGVIYEVRQPKLTLIQKLKTYRFNRKKIHKLIKEKSFHKLQNYYNYNFQDLIDSKMLVGLLEGCKSSQVLIHMIDHCLSLDCEDNDGNNILQLFIHNKAPVAVCNYLIEQMNRDQLEHINRWQFRPIHTACRDGNYDIVSRLIENDVDLECTTDKGFRSIHLACINRNIRTIDLLLKQEVELNVYDNEGYGLLEKVCQKRNIRIIEHIVGVGPYVGDLGLIKTLIDGNSNLSENEKEYAKGLVISIA